jgi:inner membrane protein
MLGKTHAVIGATVGVALAYAGHANAPMALAMMCAGAVGGLLPDIDHPGGMIRRKLWLAGDMALFWLKHRGPTHSLLMLGILFVIGTLLLSDEILGVLYFTGYAGYMAHLAADMMTPEGIPVFYPKKGYICVLPRFLAIRTGGLIEGLVGAFFGCCAMVLSLVYMAQLL